MKGWRTRIVNVLATVLPLLALAEWRDVIPADAWPIYALSLALANIVLRELTTTPAGRSK